MATVATLGRTRQPANAPTRQRSWRVLVLDGATAEEQMSIDEALARDAQPTLRLFRWKRPALSLGRNQIRPDWLDRARAAELGIEVVERPTGGGLALHGSDLSCSVVVPLEPHLRLSGVMARICETLSEACRSVGAHVEWVGELLPAGALGGPGTSARIVYCLAQRSSYALYASGKKFGGLAIRRYPRALLVQGSCALHRFPDALMRAMSEDVAHRYANQSTWLEAVSPAPVDDEVLIQSIAQIWSAP